MSHFTVTCILHDPTNADELERLLDPYDENGHLEEVTDEDGDTYSRNPNAKWDRWVIGGRWPNRLLTTRGERVNGCLRGELALDAMRAERLARAENDWAKMEAAVAAADLSPADVASYRWFKEIVQTIPDGESAWDRRRAIYWEQPLPKAMKQLDSWNAGERADDFAVGRGSFIEREALDLDCIGYATCTPEGWMSRRQMGWLGMGTDSHDSTMEYLRRMNALIDSLPPTASLIMVDCHI